MIHWRDCVIIEFLFSTGMRVQELCGLKFEDFDREEGIITVIGKGDKQRRCYITDRRVLEVYERYLKYRQCYAKNDRHIFITRFESPMSTQGVRDLVTKSTELAGIRRKVTPHTFRHTFASMLVEEGVESVPYSEVYGAQYDFYHSDLSAYFRSERTARPYG